MLGSERARRRASFMILPSPASLALSGRGYAGSGLYNAPGRAFRPVGRGP
jgi:hypothetical protein